MGAGLSGSLKPQTRSNSKPTLSQGFSRFFLARVWAKRRFRAASPPTEKVAKPKALGPKLIIVIGDDTSHDEVEDDDDERGW